MCPAHCSWRTRTWCSLSNSGSTSYSGMIAPPGSPKMVDTPSSTSDWQIALAPFKRIDVLTSAEPCGGGHKKPRLLQRRGLRTPRYHPAWPHHWHSHCRQSRIHSRRFSVRHPVAAYQVTPDRSPARLEGEFGILPAPVFHQPPALWSRTQRPYYSSSTPTIFSCKRNHTRSPGSLATRHLTR